MCPMCIGVATWYVAGASSAGGIAALAFKRSGVRNRSEPHRPFGCDESGADAGERPPESGSAAPGSRRVRLSDQTMTPQR